MPGLKKIPLAWEIVTHNKRRLALSLSGIIFSIITMFVEMGFYNGFNDSQSNITLVMDADLVLMHRKKVNMMKGTDVNRALLYQSLGVEGVREVIPVYSDNMAFRNPQTRRVNRINLIAFPSDVHPFNIAGIRRFDSAFKRQNTVLFDARSRAIFGTVREGMELELNQKKFLVGGLVELGPNFTRNGYVIMSDMNWRPQTRSPEMISFGLIRVKPGADVQQVKEEVNAMSPDTTVLTPAEVRKRDTRFWTTVTPFGIIFGAGLVIGFIIGVMICYQILFNEITDHMPQYATLKAVGFSNSYIVGVVMRVSILLSLFGFLPGVLGGWVLYRIIEHFTRITMFLTVERVLVICTLTVLMCSFSGLLAVRKVLKADPAEVF